MNDPSAGLARIEITTTDTGNPYYGKKGWIQRVQARSILDVALMANVPNVGQVHVGQLVVVFDDGSLGVAFDTYDGMADTFGGSFNILP